MTDPANIEQATANILAAARWTTAACGCAAIALIIMLIKWGNKC